MLTMTARSDRHPTVGTITHGPAMLVSTTNKQVVVRLSPLPPDDEELGGTQGQEYPAPLTLQGVCDVIRVACDEGYVLGEPLVETCKTISGAEAHKVSFEATAHSAGTVMQQLLHAGVGQSAGYGTVSVMPLDLHASAAPPHQKRHDSKRGTASSVLAVESYIQLVEKGTEFSFDYIALLGIAGLLAGIGLATDNVVVLVASMLISPLMGPVIAVTLGTSINHWALVRKGLLAGIKSLIVAGAIGAALGAIAILKGGVQDWPTAEMSLRGDASQMPLNVIVAVASGLGVCLSGLGQNANSLVGVAISASLLPPTVNAAMAMMYCLVAKADTVPDTYALTHRLEKLAFVSFALTLLNMSCIFVAGWFIFRARASMRISSGALSSEGLVEIKKMYREESQPQDALEFRGLNGQLPSELTLLRRSLNEARPHHTIAASGATAQTREPLSAVMSHAPASFDGAFATGHTGYGAADGDL